MSALLKDRVAAFIADRPDSSFQQVQRAIPARAKTLREILGGPSFESRPRASHGGDRAMVYRLAGTSGKRRDEPTRRFRTSHRQRVLNLLSDGQPHSHLEGYDLQVMLHSRVADLRREGYHIECWHEGGLYWYRLLNEPDVVGPSGSLSGRPSDPLSDASAAQLTLPVVGKGAYS